MLRGIIKYLGLVIYVFLICGLLAPLKGIIPSWQVIFAIVGIPLSLCLYYKL